MSRKHNTKHSRGKSNYPKRLRKAGLSHTPRMRWTGLKTETLARIFDRLPKGSNGDDTSD